MNQEQEQRLRNVVTALRDAAKHELFRKTFHMNNWGVELPNAERQDSEEYAAAVDNLYITVSDCEDYVSEEHLEELSDAFLHHTDELVKLVPHNCATPCCALGHFALRTDLQDYLVLNDHGYLQEAKTGYDIDVTSPGAHDYFGLNDVEFAELFGPEGCEWAEYPEDAADYIEGFINEKRRKESYYG